MNKRTVMLRLICLALAILPMVAGAQKNIQTAFDAIIKSSDAKIEESHSLDRDPVTNEKIGQSDIYHFVLPAEKMRLVKNVLSAFDKDSRMAFGLNSGKRSRNGGETLAVGDGTGAGVPVCDHDCDNYMYALFLAPKSESPEGNHRYAYAISYKESGGKIKGKLVVTYATTLKYRQAQAQERTWRRFNNYNGTSIAVNTTDDNQSWFDTFMQYVQGLESANSRTRLALVNKIYRHVSNISKYTEVTEQDKIAARELLKVLISDQRNSDAVTNKLLQQSLAVLK